MRPVSTPNPIDTTVPARGRSHARAGCNSDDSRLHTSTACVPATCTEHTPERCACTPAASCTHSSGRSTPSVCSGTDDATEITRRTDEPPTPRKGAVETPVTTTTTGAPEPDGFSSAHTCPRPQISTAGGKWSCATGETGSENWGRVGARRTLRSGAFDSRTKKDRRKLPLEGEFTSDASPNNQLVRRLSSRTASDIILTIPSTPNTSAIARKQIPSVRDDTSRAIRAFWSASALHSRMASGATEVDGAGDVGKGARVFLQKNPEVCEDGLGRRPLGTAASFGRLQGNVGRYRACRSRT